jgi:hypothetical protein
MLRLYNRSVSMKVNWRNADDAEQLRIRIAEQTDAKQRDRYRVVLIAGQGLGEKPELQREEIAAVVGRSRQFVDSWVGRYRKGGLEALVATPPDAFNFRMGRLAIRLLG